MTSPASDALPLGLTPGRRTAALAIVLIAFFMDLLDTTIVNVAIPSIQADLGASYSSVQWIIAGYALAFALFLITGGRLGDIFGYKQLFIGGVTGFTLASTLCGLSGTTGMLIAARFLQGFTAAMMVPQILSLIQVMYTTAKERRNVSGAYGAAAGLATVAGPILGALLINADIFDLGWRTIFLVNIPIGLGGAVLAAVYLPSARNPNPLRLDIVGVLIIVTAMLMLMYPLIQGRELDWPWWTFALMAASLPVFVFFAWSQRRKELRDGSPLVVTELFRQRTFVAGVLVIGAFFAIVGGYFLVQQLLFQLGLGYPVLKAGLTGIPFSIGIGISAGISGQVLVPKLGRRALSIGAVVMAAGLGSVVWAAHHFGADLQPWHLIVPLFVAGSGMGAIIAPVYSFVLAAVPVKHAGSASGVINAIGQIGGAIGVAVLGVIYFNLLSSQAAPSAADVRAELDADLATIGVPATVRPAMLDGFAICFADRATEQDPFVNPPSCAAGEAAIASLTAAFPGLDGAAISTALNARGLEANQRNFSSAFETTVLVAIGGLGVIFLLIFLLPPKPREDLDLLV